MKNGSRLRALIILPSLRTLKVKTDETAWKSTGRNNPTGRIYDHQFHLRGVSEQWKNLWNKSGLVCGRLCPNSHFMPGCSHRSLTCSFLFNAQPCLPACHGRINTGNLSHRIPTCCGRISTGNISDCIAQLHFTEREDSIHLPGISNSQPGRDLQHGRRRFPLAAVDRQSL